MTYLSAGELLFIFILYFCFNAFSYKFCRWNEFCQDVSLEKAGWFFETSAVSKWHMDYEHVDNENSNYLESSGYGFPCKFSSELHDNMPLNQGSHKGTRYEIYRK